MTRIVGIILIVLGVLALVYQGITYTTDETLVEMGPLEISTAERRTIPLPPVVGGLMLVGGVVLLVADSRRGA